MDKLFLLDTVPWYENGGICGGKPGPQDGSGYSGGENGGGGDPGLEDDGGSDPWH